MQKRPRRDHDIIAGLAGEQPRLQGFIRIVSVVDDLYAGFSGEIFENLRIDIVAPVIDINAALPGARCNHAGEKRQKNNEKNRNEVFHRLALRVEVPSFREDLILDQDPKKQTNTASLLVIGGARSGKSSFAQKLAENSGKRPVLIATAEAHDAEMAARLEKHKSTRKDAWRVVEEPHALVAVLRREARTDRVVVVDCLTLWLSNRLLSGGDVEAEGDALAGLVEDLAGPVVLVTNEVGTGIVPDTRLGRVFRDAQGCLNQKLAGVCERVVLVAAGLPLTLKPAPDLTLRF